VQLFRLGGVCIIGMKTLPLPPLLVTTLALTFGSVLAQNADPIPPGPPPLPSPSALPAGNPSPSGAIPPPPAGERHGPMGGLTEAEKAQVKAAHDKAIQQDPKLEQRMKEARQALEAAKKALHDAMVKVDPTVEPVLAKMMPPPRPPTQVSGSPSSAGTNPPVIWTPSHHLPPPGLANLTDQERERIKALHEQVRNDPSVMSAREALRTATTPEAQKAAEEALHLARKEAMLKADPSAAEILNKITPTDASSPQPSASPSPAS
jgi:hypothetical protein